MGGFLDGATEYAKDTGLLLLFSSWISLGWSMELWNCTSNGEGTLMLRRKHQNGDTNRTLIFFLFFWDVKSTLLFA